MTELKDKLETLEAIRKSRKKWEMISEGKMKNEGGDNCPLCRKYPDRCRDYKSSRVCPIVSYADFFLS